VGTDCDPGEHLEGTNNQKDWRLRTAISVLIVYLNFGRSKVRETRWLARTLDGNGSAPIRKALKRLVPAAS